MFEKMFKLLIDKNILIKTEYVFMFDNQGDYLYKIKPEYKKEFVKQIIKNGVECIEQNEDVVVLFYNNNFIGAFE